MGHLCQRLPVQVLSTPLLIQLPANAPNALAMKASKEQMDDIKLHSKGIDEQKSRDNPQDGRKYLQIM